MVFTLDKIGKKYGAHQLFSGIDLVARQDEIIGISGPNGSGKSTLLKIIAGFVTPSQGKATFTVDQQVIPTTEWYQHLSLAAPYLQAPLDFKLSELIDFHFTFKDKYDPSMSNGDIIHAMKLEAHQSKTLRQFSSGMLMRLGLGLSLFSQTALLLLDEPTSNLDEEYKAWFATKLREYHQGRICFLASNERSDLQLTDRVLKIQ